MESTLIPCDDDSMGGFGRINTRASDGLVYVTPVCTCDIDETERAALIAGCEFRLVANGVA